MKFYRIILLTLFFSCNQNQENSILKDHNLINRKMLTTKFGSTGNSINGWIESFVIFRNGIYERNKSIKEIFFKFPILNTNNEIWYLIYEGNEKLINEIPDTIKPFTEKDLDDYFNIIFTQAFRKSLLKIDTLELHNKLESHTEILTEPDDIKSTYQTFAKMDTTNSEFTLSILYRSFMTVKDENSNPVEEISEFNVIYVFKVIDKKKIEFKEIRLAG